MSQEKKIAITIQSYKNWDNAYKIENEFLQLIVVTDIGPRILHFSLKNGENLFHEIEYTKEQLQENTWKNYGGHRLWIAPEDKLITYQPDNKPVDVEINENKLKIIQREDPITRTVKEIEIIMHPTKPYIQLIHRIINKGNKDFEISAWAITALRQGGNASIPLGKKGKHPDDLLPNYSIALWSYTNLADRCLNFDSEAIRFAAREKCSYPQKIGSSGSGGWTAYHRNATSFIKAYQYYPEGKYPDHNSSVEIFSNGKFVELETLSPLKKLAHKESIEHKEYWTIQETGDAKILEEQIPKLRLEIMDSFKK